jgi:hypothetical protein
MPIYPINPSGTEIFLYNFSINIAPPRLSSMYTIGSGNLALHIGTMLFLSVYCSEIIESKAIPYICHPRRDPIYPIIAAQKNDLANISILLPICTLVLYIFHIKTIKNHIIHHASESS